MKTLIVLFIVLGIPTIIQAQNDDWQKYEPNKDHPYGQLNPAAPSQMSDFEPMIGTCDCKSLRRAPDRSWADTAQIVWSFKYIMNGMAIQDITWSEGTYATSIRQFHPDSSRWVVNYASYPGISTAPTPWFGNKEGDYIKLEKPQKAPNGMEGISRLSFSNISGKGFEWKGEWINEAQGIVFPFWQIWCVKRDD